MKVNIKKHFLLITSFMLWSVFLFPPDLYAQTGLDDRVGQIEEYLSSFQPVLSQFAKDMEDTMHKYTKNLEDGLSEYTEKLQMRLSEQIKSKNSDVVVLDIASKVFQKIDTNAGTFLVYVNKISPINGGIKLNLFIGNPYFANFKDFKVDLVTGRKFPEGGALSYDAWRGSLIEKEYSFSGVLEKGKWNSVDIDISPAEIKDIEYVECSLFISSVELDLNK